MTWWDCMKPHWENLTEGYLHFRSIHLRIFRPERFWNRKNEQRSKSEFKLQDYSSLQDKAFEYLLELTKQRQDLDEREKKNLFQRLGYSADQDKVELAKALCEINRSVLLIQKNFKARKDKWELNVTNLDSLKWENTERYVFEIFK